jgi:molybdenum ABC transporter molybdate-binding protein
MGRARVLAIRQRGPNAVADRQHERPADQQRDDEKMDAFGHSSLALRSRRLRFRFIVALCWLLIPALAQARDLVVYGEPTLERALKSVGTLWQARSGTRVNVYVARTDLALAQIERGARCDLIFALPGEVTDDAARRRIVHADTMKAVLRNSLVLVGAVLAESRASITPADLSKLIAGKKLAIADPGRDPAGALAVELLRGIGIAADDSNKIIVVAESSAGVVNMLATAKAELGIVYATDAIGRFKLVVALPTQVPIEYVVAQARDPVLDTKPFLAFLKSPEAKATFRSAGLVPVEDSGSADSTAGRKKQ